MKFCDLSVVVAFIQLYVLLCSKNDNSKRVISRHNTQNTHTHTHHTHTLVLLSEFLSKTYFYDYC